MSKRQSTPTIDFPAPGCPRCGASLYRARRLSGPHDRPDLDYWAGGECYGRGVRWQRVECRTCGRRANLRIPLSIEPDAGDKGNDT